MGNDGDAIYPFALGHSRVLDGLARRLSARAGVHGHAPVDLFDGRGDNLLLLVGVEGIALTGSAEDKDPMHARRDLVVDELTELGVIDFLVRPHRRDDGRDNTVDLHEDSRLWVERMALPETAVSVFEYWFRSRSEVLGRYRPYLGMPFLERAEPHASVVVQIAAQLLARSNYNTDLSIHHDKITFLHHASRLAAMLGLCHYGPRLNGCTR